jgi:putative addiction module component (TIGR02574 family)
MSPNLETLGITQMPIPDSLSLVHAIWDSIAADVEQSPLTAAERAEVDRRLEAHRKNPQAAIPWEQVEAEALARFRK